MVLPLPLRPSSAMRSSGSMRRLSRCSTGVSRIADRRHVERDQRRLQLRRAGEVEAQARIVGQRGDRLHLRQHLGARLRLLGGRGAGAVAGDIVLQARALRVLRGLRRGELRRALGALALEAVIAAGVERDLAALEVEDGVDDVVEQVALVADHDQRAGIALEEVLEPQRRFEVEVVRRLVEQQQVGLGEQQRGERDAHLPAARIAVERPAPASSSSKPRPSRMRAARAGAL